MDNTPERDNARHSTELMVDLDALEKEIARLWHRGRTERNSISELPTRSSVLNLVIYAADADTVQRARHVAEQLSTIHPCRAIVFQGVDHIEQRADEPQIYATCARDEAHPHAPCIERIDIPVPPSMLDHLPSIIEPLVIPGLPTFFWWPGTPPFGRPELTALAGVSHRLVVDSIAFALPGEMQDFYRLQQSLPSCVTTDLNWERLQPWRELTAQFFDIRHVQWALEHVREVEVECGQTEPMELPAQALLFGCWLTHCLGWEVFEARRTRRDRWYIGAVDHNHQAVRIMIRTRPTSPDYAGQLLSLSVLARDDNSRSSSLSLSRSRGTALIRMHAKSGLHTALLHAVHHPLLPEEALLARVLESTSHDYVFEKALRHAAGVIDRVGRRSQV